MKTQIYAAAAAKGLNDSVNGECFCVLWGPPTKFHLVSIHYISCTGYLNACKMKLKYFFTSSPFHNFQ